ncbi:MAG: hypothetical protein HC836_22165 [Richelia sp. RM2_1_2]|nr:hypothetical protein [Richelia sp. RM2_1_2]
MSIEKKIDKASSSEPSYLFRADDNYKIGNPVGFKLDSEEAIAADIQNPWVHVLDKESVQTSRYISFSTAITIQGGGGSLKFTKNNKIFKVPWKALQQLKTEGKIRIYTPEDVAEIINQHPKKKVRRKANDVKAAMEKNGEIIIEGQIPGNVIIWAN